MPKVKFKARTTAEIENLDIENGSLVYDTQNGKTYLDYNGNRIPTGGGSSGSGIPVSDTPPTYPLENDLWVDTTTDSLKRYNGTNWIIIGAEVDDEVSTTSTNAVQNQAITNYVNNRTTDYIVEQETSGIWTYRKWNSGISECWGNKVGNINVTNQWGGQYFYYGMIGSENFPTNLFINTPTISFQNVAGTTLISGNGSDASSTSTGAIQVMRATSVSNATYNMCIRAIGRWK